MKVQNPNYRDDIVQAFTRQAFAHLLGIEIAGIGEGWVETRLQVGPQHMQHDGVVHGGVPATLADLSAALAAHTLIAPGERVLTIEFKINYLRPVRQDLLLSRGQVLRQGRSVTVSEAEIFAVRDGSKVLVAKAMVTIAIVSDNPKES